MAIDFIPFEEKKEDEFGFIPFTEEKTPVSTIRPGDVAARQAQVDAAAAKEGPNQVRPDLSFTEELGTGLGNAAEGVGRTLAALIPGTGVPLSELVPNEASVAGVAESPIPQAALGGLQAAGSFLAPVSNAASRLGEKASDALSSAGFEGAADWAGSIATAAADVLAPGAILKGAKGVQAIGKNITQGVKNAGFTNAAAKLDRLTEPSFYQSGRSKAAGATAAAEARIAAQQAATEAAQEIAEKGTITARSSAEAATESFESFRAAARSNAPSKADLERIGGKALSEATGKEYATVYHAARGPVKDKGDEIYARALGPKPQGAVDSAVDKLDESMSTRRTLQDDVFNARSPEERRTAEDILDRFIDGGKAPEIVEPHALHDALIATRREHRMASKSAEDNRGRLLGIKEENILKKLEKVRPGSTRVLQEADDYYKTAYAPYFGKGAVTRSIADKDPAGIARNAILPTSRTGKGKEVETIERTIELIGRDSPLHKKLGQAHVNGMIDDAEKAGGSFNEAIIKQWEKYTSVRGNNNKVLRAAHGKDYESLNSVMNQYKNTKPKALDKMVDEMVRNANRTADATVSRLEGAAKFAATNLKTESKRVHKQLEGQILEFMGKPSNAVVRLEGIGLGVFTSGVAGQSGGRTLKGGAIAVSARGLAKILESKRGRSIWKAVLRGTPGTAQAAAVARIAETLANAVSEGE